MKDKILLALRAKYNKLGFSEKAINGVLAYLEKTVTADDQIDTSVDAVEGMLTAFQTEIDSRVNTAVAKAKQPPADPPKPAPADPDPAKPADDTPAWAKALIEQNKTLSDKISAIELGKSADTRKSQLEIALKDVADSFKGPALKAFARMQFKDDEEFKTYLDEIKTDSAAFVQSEADVSLSKSRPPMAPAGSASKTASKEELDLVMPNLL